MKIHGFIFLLIGVFVVIASLLFEELKIFMVVGGLFILYGLGKMAAQRITKYLSPKPEDDQPINLDKVPNPYLQRQQMQQQQRQTQAQQMSQMQKTQHNTPSMSHAHPQHATHASHVRQTQYPYQQQGYPQQQSVPQAGIPCKKCGAKNMSHARFCNGCGAALR